MDDRQKREDHDLHADLHWEINACNPRNWGYRKKWIHTIVSCAIAWVISLGTAIMTPAHDVLMEEFGASSIVLVLPTSLYILGLTAGPFLSGLGTEIFGRKHVYMLCVPLYAIFVLAGGLMKTMYGLVLCRFFAGLCSSPALHLGWGTISDIWVAEERTTPTTIYIVLTALGSSLGPVIGGYVVWKQTWRWTQFVVLFAFGGCLPPIMAMHETSKRAILRKKRKESARAPLYSEYLTEHGMKPFRMLKDPIMLMYSLYTAFNFGVLYAIYTAFPSIFARAEAFTPGAQGLAFLGMTLGVIIGLLFLLVYNTCIYEPRVVRYKDEKATEEERTLYTSRRGSKHSRHQRTIPTPTGSQAPLRPIFAAEESRTRRRSSLVQSWKRLSSAAGPKPGTHFHSDSDRNVKLAYAAATYLNKLEYNQGKRILPDRILILLNQNVEFGPLCTALEGYNLKLDRVALATVLVDALTEDNSTALEGSYSVAIETEHHRNAAALALEAPSPSPDASRPNSLAPPSATTVTEKRTTWFPWSNVPPPEWRLWLALPASALLPASLFMLGWTAEEGLHWIAPIVALCLYALSALVVFVSLTQYMFESYGATHSEAVWAGSAMMRYVFGCALALVSFPAALGLGPGLGMSVLALVGTVLGLVPSVLYLFGGKLRRRQKYRERK